jgi:hypothetical protein
MFTSLTLQKGAMATESNNRGVECHFIFVVGMFCYSTDETHSLLDMVKNCCRFKENVSKQEKFLLSAHLMYPLLPFSAFIFYGLHVLTQHRHK